MRLAKQTVYLRLNSRFYSATPEVRFASNTVFSDCGTNVFRDNYGRLRYEGSAEVTRATNVYVWHRAHFTDVIFFR